MATIEEFDPVGFITFRPPSVLYITLPFFLEDTFVDEWIKLFRFTFAAMNTSLGVCTVMEEGP